MKPPPASSAAPQPTATQAAGPAQEMPVPIDSRLLFGDARTVFIDHCGQRYVLRVTRENKLILTK